MTARRDCSALVCYISKKYHLYHIQLILGQIIHNACGTSDIQAIKCTLLLVVVCGIDFGKEKFDR